MANKTPKRGARGAASGKRTRKPATRARKAAVPKEQDGDTGPAAPRFSPTPLKRPQDHETIRITSHRELAVKSGEVAARVSADPEFSVMFLSNPVLALEAYGIKLSKEMQHHVLTSLRHPEALANRREELESKLQESLGEPAKPTDPKWMANLVFEVRAIAPRQIGKREPAYKEPINADSIKRLQGKRPKGGPRYSADRRLPVRFSLKLARPKSAIRRMDLDAELPTLKPRARPPARLTLEEAWFYKDDPVVRDAVELGQIMRRGFPFRTPAEFRKIEAGELVDGFRRFVRSVEVEGVAEE